MSQILDIITAIGLVDIETLTQRPIVLGVENAAKSVRKLPARVIFPVQIGDNDGESSYVTLGNTMQHEWTIYDVMLYHSAQNTSSHLQFISELAVYAGNYLTAFKPRINQKLGLSQVTITQIRVQWVDFEFPPGSKNVYHSVLSELTVKEIES